MQLGEGRLLVGRCSSLIAGEQIMQPSRRHAGEEARLKLD
jgi:hypothetical protein